MHGEYQDPSQETRVRVQDDNETARFGSSVDHVRPPWKLGDQLNDFVLEKYLGRGASGFVYRALDTVTQRRCALKLLLPSTPEDLVRNKLGFRRMMSIQHPSLMKVDRIYHLGGHTALSMEEVDGETLPHAVRKLRGLDVGEAYNRLLKLARHYAAGLAAMHGNGYVHRDIKPQNLMVDRLGNGRVIDYGLVGTFDPETDPHGHRHYLAGTPRYFSPEMLWDQFYLPAGDIFALGVVMLESLHAISRVRGDEEFGVQRSETSQRDDAERISESINELDSSVPNSLRAICLEMLQREPGDRPTAMRVARLGLSNAAIVAWPQENPLIGREREVAVISSWLDDIYGGAVGRLHLTGPLGIGKTRLIDDIEKYIRSMRWGQVFRARCRLREDQPLQAFDQICDAIASRYKQGDREPLELDPVSTTILHAAFPVLKNIVHCSMRLSPAGTTTERLDALEAAARMSDELRKVGPLILIIDDAQWADRDSLNLLDRLQTASGDIGLGIITVSRDEVDSQRIPAGHHLALKPLDTSHSVAMLAEAAESRGVEVSKPVLEELAEAAAGSPFRLHELADEFRSGGALTRIDTAINPDDSVSQLGPIDRLWQKRASRLSEDAHRVLSFVVTAGRRVSTKQLGELTGLGDAVDVAVSELAQQRLVIDEATGGECIQIVHDKVANGLIRTLAGGVKRKAHHAWAGLLVRQDHPEKLAARIAGHFFASGEPGRAVSYAVLAAEDAERLVAKTEAARWHAMVVNHVEGSEKIARLRHAARCFLEADHPIKASQCYRRLADHVSIDERIECQLLAASLSIRGGHFVQVRGQLQELAKTLGLPRPKPPVLSKVVLTFRASLQRMRDIFARGSKTRDVAKIVQQPANVVPASRRDQQRLDFCLGLVRPMSMFDNLYSAELSMTCEQLASKNGTEAQRIHSAIGQAVYGCYDKGSKRNDSEQTLQSIRAHVESMQNPRLSGDMWAGVAYSHALSCRWDQVSAAVQSSIANYESVSDSRGFEIAHTQWIGVWAAWNLGRWDSVVQICDAMFDDAVRRNDAFQRLVVTSGYCCSAWLARDRTGELDRIRAEDDGLLIDESLQMFHLFGWITSVQCLIYQGRFEDAWSVWKSLESKLNKLPYSKLQMIRVVRQSLGALVALHLLRREKSAKWTNPISRLVRQLRREQLPYARVLSNLYEGLMHQQMATVETDSQIGSQAGSQSSSTLNAARSKLLLARREAHQHRLTPLQLAADDALAQINTNKSLGLLRDRMVSQGVTKPSFFERLYTLEPSEFKRSRQETDRV